MDSIKNYLDNIFNGVDENIKLDENQKMVVLDNSKNIIVVAGAGSGKTTTITAKIKYLVEIKHIKPEQILVISFTNKAINELRERINEDFKINADIYTFHKFAFDILKKFNSKYKIVQDSELILKKIIKKEKNNEKIIKILKQDKIYKKNSKKASSDLEYFIKYTVENINLFRMKQDLEKNNYKEKYKKYLDYLKYISNKYEKYMNENNLVDFESLIIETTKIISSDYINYKYIIIDEYQDISINRFNLVKKISEICDVKILVVGDDWQAIFSFAGSDTNLFLNYQKLMNAKMYKIINTYRNSQELIDIAGNFIMQNNKQIKKQLVSIKSKKNPIEIFNYTNNFDKILKLVIEKIVKEYGEHKTILILGRYKNDRNRLSNLDFTIKENKIIYKKYKHLVIDYMTVHASKGLGYDNVILINALDDVYGFPSKIKDDYVRKILSTNENTILEERRLFYVAITRTKNKFYIITNKRKASPFVKELLKYENVFFNKKS